MRYTPKAQVDIDSLSWFKPGLRVALLPLQESRPEPNQIGENVEEQTRVPIYEARPGGTLAAVDAALRRELGALGVALVPPGTNAQKQLRLTLVRLWVSENNTYNGEVQLFALAKLRLPAKFARSSAGRAFDAEGGHFGTRCSRG